MSRRRTFPATSIEAAAIWFASLFARRGDAIRTLKRALAETAKRRAKRLERKDARR